MGAGKVILGTVGTVLAGALVAGGVAMAVPQSRNWILDEIAKTSNIHKKVVAENDDLKLALDELKIQLQTEKETVVVLIGQRTELLNTVTALDNQINSTTDATTIETLQAKKTAILSQVDDLNGQIAEKQAEIERLQARVDELEEVSAQSQTYYTITIDTTNAIEQITIEDTKLGSVGYLSNVDITSLELFSWQNATIKYANVENSKVYAVLNGVQSTSDSVTIIGSENKGTNVNISSVLVSVSVENAYAGVWACGELGESGNGNGDYQRLFVVTIDEDMNTNISIICAETAEQTLALASSDLTEIEGGYQLHFDEEGMLHTMKLLEDGTMSVSLYDGAFGGICKKVTSKSYNDFVGNWSGNALGGGICTINVNEDNSVHIEVQVDSETQTFDFASENISVENGVMTLTITEADGYTFQLYAFVSNDTLVVSFPSAYVEATRG